MHTALKQYACNQSSSNIKSRGHRPENIFSLVKLKVKIFHEKKMPLKKFKIQPFCRTKKALEMGRRNSIKCD